MIKYCPNCKEAVYAEIKKQTIGCGMHLIHLIISILLFPWVIVWIVHSIAGSNTITKCSECGCQL